MSPFTLIRYIREPPQGSMAWHIIQEHGDTMARMPFVMLVNLLWLFIWPVLSKASFVEVILPTLISVPVFLYFHLSSYYYPGARESRVRYILGGMSLAYAVAPFNFAASAYLIFGFFTIAYAATPRVARYIVFGSIALMAVQLYYLSGNLTAIGSVLFPAVILGIIALYTSKTAHQARALRHSQEEIHRLATIAERERIARDLHDVLGHTLSLVALKSELARKLLDRDPEAARAEIQEVERVARAALTEVRSAVSGMRNTAFAAELVAATALLEAQGVHVEAQVQDVKLPHDRETALALSLREAATNVSRHAAATGVKISLRQEEGRVTLEITDDGRGGRIVPGNGLNGMRERLSNVGGTLNLEPNGKHGTRLLVSLPVAA
jgi:two-component system, NarL family, sensor histidine kinase DesK